MAKKRKPAMEVARVKYEQAYNKFSDAYLELDEAVEAVVAAAVEANYKEAE